MPNLEPKVPYLRFLGLEFSKTITIFEISTLKFVYLQHFAKKNMRIPKFGTKTGLFGYFWFRLLKNYCHI